MKACNQCGKCCTRYGGDGGLSASRQDLESWEEHRPDIFAYVRNDEIWFNPASGEQLGRCPWLRQLPGQPRYVCDIYDDRPEDCRHYPVEIEQMVRDDCEMLERADLHDARKAQQTLDNLMADSRPAVIRR